MKRHLSGAALVLLALCPAALAQQTTGNVIGRVIDGQGAAVPGASVTARNPATGFTRTELSDGEGLYRLLALPVGTYDVTTELSGFATISKKDVIVAVATTVTIDFSLRLAALAETVTVT